MNIYIVTENNFFFIGIKDRIHVNNATVQKISTSELGGFPSKKFNKDDVFIFYTSNFDINLSFNISTNKLPGKLIFIPTSRGKKTTPELNKYIHLDPYAPIEKILSTIMDYSEDRTTRHHEGITKLTNREKTVLEHFFNGKNVNKIGQLMSISIKTVYAHRKNALTKLGGRNIFEIWPLRERALHTEMFKQKIKETSEEAY